MEASCSDTHETVVIVAAVAAATFGATPSAKQNQTFSDSALFVVPLAKKHLFAALKIMPKPMIFMFSETDGQH
eukprot:3610093-Amphidinium_carterae.1